MDDRNFLRIPCIYCGWVKIDLDVFEAQFKWNEVHIDRYINEDEIVLKHRYFIHSGCSTRLFNRDMLDKEYEIGSCIKAFYTADKDKCIEWLHDTKERLIDKYNMILSMISSESIEEKKYKEGQNG